MHVSSHKLSSTHPLVQTVCILCAVYQPLCECVAAGITQCCMFTALQTSLSQQNRPDLAHRLTPLLLPGVKRKPRHSHLAKLKHNCALTHQTRAHFLVLWVNLSVSLSRARAYSASMSPRRRRNSERSESCCCFTSTWESKIFIWSVSWVRRSDTHTDRCREEGEDI